MAMQSIIAPRVVAHDLLDDLPYTLLINNQWQPARSGANDAVPSTAQAPFEGMKQSGIGHEGGSVGIDEYLEVKFVSLGL